ncbi:Hypothetical protein BN117_0489 [Bordetella parapertussis Bpp5]|uniref:Uncharacterized protein n=1 Tax=Bordetella parapertussis (strain Bpp5) TaxID=1208660 RepID=K0M842_BORPB|nr:Hypothetical protein BN117_0489 [Bordetella parapertussis Bpp5]
MKGLFFDATPIYKVAGGLTAFSSRVGLRASCHELKSDAPGPLTVSEIHDLMALAGPHGTTQHNTLSCESVFLPWPPTRSQHQVEITQALVERRPTPDKGKSTLYAGTEMRRSTLWYVGLLGRVLLGSGVPS